MPLNYLKQVQELDPTFVTVRERARLQEEVKLGDPDITRWRGLFPRTVVRSTEFKELERDNTARYAAGHREWNAQPYERPRPPINLREGLEIKPVESSQHFGEQELTNLAAMGATDDMVRQFLLESVGDVIPDLFDIVDRAIEVQAFQAWFTGKYTVRDNKGQSESIVDLKVPDEHITAADNTEFNDDAWQWLLDEVVEATRIFGTRIGGIRASSQLIRKILSDAPLGDAVYLRESAAMDLFEEENGYRIRLTRDDRTVKRHTTGSPGDPVDPEGVEDGFYVPRDSIAFVPADGQVGYTAFVPVVARDDVWMPQFSRRADQADFTVIYVGKDGGRNLEVSCQANALSVPAIDSTYVKNGITLLP